MIRRLLAGLLALNAGAVLYYGYFMAETIGLQIVSIAVGIASVITAVVAWEGNRI